MNAGATSQLLRSLAADARTHPLERKLLVCDKPAHGRELLRTLAAAGVPWIGYDVTTPERLAAQLVAADLALEQLIATDEFDELAMLDAAMDEVLGESTGGLASLAEGYGLRQALGHAVRGLRLAGVGVVALERARFRDEEKRAQIAQILAAYERMLGERHADSAAMLRRAVAGLAVGTLELPYAHVRIMPGQTRRGLSGQLLDVLVERGALVLPTDPVVGLPQPAQWLTAEAAAQPGRLSWLHAPAAAPSGEDTDIAMFAASSVVSELREVLRRVLAAGLRWDEVEIIATDAGAYGVALDGVARRLGIPVSYGSGLPVSRTRAGRAIAKYLEWVRAGFPADVLRQMLEHGDIGAPQDAGVSGTALGRLLRRLKVGRGRERYETALRRRERALAQPQAADDERSPEEFAEARARETAELQALASVLRPLIAATPAVHGDSRIAPAEIAAGVQVLLELVRPGTAVDATARERLLERIRRMAATLQRPMALDAAVAVVMSKLEDRVPAPNAPGSAPWTPSGGFLHLSDIDHGGYSGRRATFIVGLDAARFPGGRFTDALLVDDDRRRIIGGEGAASLPLAAERLDERRYRFAALAARLRGRITFSYAGWDAVEGRAVAPASELLQVFRLLTGNASADYDAMHAALSPAASPIPQHGARLDADDVWFDALAADGRLRAGLHVVEEVYPELRAGVRGYRERGAQQPSARHGVIRPRPSLDPRDDATRAVSATQLQVLGTCPHRYLLRYVLGVRAPEDPELSLEVWLNELEKGALMHRVYERALSSARDDDLDLHSDAFERRVLDILDDEAERLREELPPPGEAIFRLECELLRDDVRAFVAMVRQDGDRHIALEKKFGREGVPAVPVMLPDGRVLHVTGAIDRIDRLADGNLVVIDYKTGRRTRFGARNGAYDGGRRLQHVLYAAVAQVLCDAAVVRAEYHFPTRASENYRAAFEASELREGLGVVAGLLDMAARGEFVPTNEPDDCAYCDYAAVCRVRDAGYGRTDSPLAQWSRNVESDVLDVLRGLRR